LSILRCGQVNEPRAGQVQGFVSGSAWICIVFGSWIRIRIKVRIHEISRLKIESWRAWTLKMEAWRLKMEVWRVCRPVVADSHHLQEQNQDLHRSEKLDPDPNPH
jgi:hypothetical protein